MKDLRQFYINGQWRDPIAPRDLSVENPSTSPLPYDSFTSVSLTEHDEELRELKHSCRGHRLSPC